jgi:hypothetical protein
MENEQEISSPVSPGSSVSSPSGSSVSSPSGSSVSSHESSADTVSSVGSEIPDVNEPQMGDGPEMLLWRATVNPLNNIGSPINAEWDYSDGIPNTAEQNRSSIRQAVVREMVLTYPDGGEGYWIPGEAVETVYFPFFPEDSGQEWHGNIPGPDYDYYEVEHSTNIPIDSRRYNSQYAPPQYYPMDSASILVDDVLYEITRDLYGKSKKYIRNYVDRYFVTPTISYKFTAKADKAARNIIVSIFILANRVKTHDEVEVFVEEEWAQHIRDKKLFSFIFFDENQYKDDAGGVKFFNKKGKSLRPANKDELRRGIAAGSQYTPRFNPSPSPNSRKNIRRRTQRRRDKKIIKERRSYLESIKDNPDLMYGNDEVDRAHNDKMNKLHQELRQKVNEKQMHGRGCRATRRRKYKRTTRKFCGKKQIK